MLRKLHQASCQLKLVSGNYTGPQQTLVKFKKLSWASHRPHEAQRPGMVISVPLMVLFGLLQVTTVSLDGSMLDCAEGTDLGTETVTVILHVLLTLHQGVPWS